MQLGLWLREVGDGWASFEKTFGYNPHQRMQDQWDAERHRVIIIVPTVFYTAGFLICCCFLTGFPQPGEAISLRDKPWIPTRFRGDACLTPLLFVWPAFFWPLFVAYGLLYGILYVIFYILKGLFYMVCHLIGSSTTCCGIPLPRSIPLPRWWTRIHRWWTRIVRDGPAAASSEADLEMGSVVSSAEDEGDEEPEVGKEDSDPVGVRSAGSGESERPPSYTSLPVSRDQDEEGSGEADGLLDKSTEG